MHAARQPAQPQDLAGCRLGNTPNIMLIRFMYTTCSRSLTLGSRGVEFCICIGSEHGKRRYDVLDTIACCRHPFGRSAEGREWNGGRILADQPQRTAGLGEYFSATRDLFSINSRK